MRVKGWLLAIGVTSALAAAASGCSIPDTSQRGFGSRQVLHIREDGLGLRSFSYDLSAIYLAHAIPGIMTSNGVSAPYDRTLLDLTTGLEKPISPGVVEADLLPVAAGTGRSLVLQHYDDDASIPAMLTSSTVSFVRLTFLDEVTGTKVDLPTKVRAFSVSLGATRSDAILVSQPKDDGSTNVRPAYGPPEAVVPMRSDVDVVVGRDRQGFVALTAGDQSQSFTRFPFDMSQPPVPISPGSIAVRTIVQGDDGAPQNTTPALLPPDDVTPVISCPPAPAAGAAPQNCMLFYDRTFSDGSSSGFVHFLDDGRDVQLPGTMTSMSHLADTMNLSPTGKDMYWLQTESAGSETRVYTWHVDDARAASCTIPRTIDRRNFAQAAWQPGTGRFAVIAQSNSQSSAMAATWALIEGTAGGGCQIVTTGQNLISQVQISPAGDQLALLESDSLGNSTVYLGPLDGTVPVPAATGSYYFSISYLDARHLLLWHSNTNGYSLSWLDVGSVPAMEHAIADRVRWDARGAWAWLTPKWVLLADADLQQDGSYSLDAVNIETGEERLVSRGVVDFRVSWPTPPPGATELMVTYTVRSRTESSQDGIWVAHLPLAQFAD